MSIERQATPPEGHGAGSCPAQDKQRPVEAAKPPPGTRRRGRPPGPRLTPEEEKAVAADQAARWEWQQRDFQEQVLAYCHQAYPDPLTPQKLAELRQAFEAGHKTRSVDLAWLLDRHARPRLEMLEESLATRPTGASYDSFEAERLDIVHNYVTVLEEILPPPPARQPEEVPPQRD